MHDPFQGGYRIHIYMLGKYINSKAYKRELYKPELFSYIFRMTVNTFWYISCRMRIHFQPKNNNDLSFASYRLFIVERRKETIDKKKLAWATKTKERDALNISVEENDRKK